MLSVKAKFIVLTFFYFHFHILLQKFEVDCGTSIHMLVNIVIFLHSKEIKKMIYHIKKIQPSLYGKNILSFSLEEKKKRECNFRKDIYEFFIFDIEIVD